MLKNIEERIKEFNEIIRKYPNINEFYIGRAILYEENKQYKEALDDYRRANSNNFFYDIISICERNNLKKEAEELYTKAIKEDKENIKNYIRRAYFYKCIGERRKALCDCNTVLKVDPNNETILTLKAILKAKK